MGKWANKLDRKDIMIMADNIQLLVDFFIKLNCTFKVKLKNIPETNNWDKLFIRPAKSYVEFGQTGPVKISEVEWLDINPIEEIYIGTRVPSKYFDHSDSIKNYLDQHSIQYSIYNNIIRIVLSVEDLRTVT
jgi:hypothetical protein